MPAIGIGISPVFGGGNPVSLDPDYTVYEAAMSVAPSASWRAAINQMILDIKSALSITNLSDAFDAMWFLAAETEQASRLNMVKRSHDCTASAAPTFEASRGVTGNGTTQYLDTNYNPSTQGLTYMQDSASMGFYCRSALSENGRVDIGHAGSAHAYINARSAAGTCSWRINNTNDILTAIAASTGLIAQNRSASNSSQLYRNGSSLVTNASASTGLPGTFYLCCLNNNGTPSSFSTRQLALAFAGRSMTVTEHANFYTAVQTAMTTIGANV